MKHLSAISKEFMKLALSDPYWNDLNYFEQRKYIQQHPGTKKRITVQPPMSDTSFQVCPLCDRKFVDKDKVLTHIKADHSFADTTPEAMQTYTRFKKIYDNAKKMRTVDVINELPPLEPQEEDIHKTLFMHYGSKIRQEINGLKEPIRHIIISEDAETQDIDANENHDLYKNLVEKLKLTPIFDESSGEESKPVVLDLSEGGKEQAYTGKSLGERLEMQIAKGTIDNIPVIVSNFYRSGTSKGTPHPYEDSGVELFFGATKEEEAAFQKRMQERQLRREERKLQRSKEPRGQRKKIWTDRKVKRLGRQIARDLKSSGMLENDDAVYDTVRNRLEQDPTLKEFFKAKGISDDNIVFAFADYIPVSYKRKHKSME